MALAPKIYLDTSVINFLFATDSPDYMASTRDFFNTFIKPGIYDPCVSDFVIEEITNTSDQGKRMSLLKVITDYRIELLRTTPQQDAEIKALSDLYLDAGVIPKKNFMDALHIATTVLFEIPYLVSWNFKHMANVSREERILHINHRHNYLSKLRIITPLELMNDEN